MRPSSALLLAVFCLAVPARAADFGDENSGKEPEKTAVTAQQLDGALAKGAKVTDPRKGCAPLEFKYHGAPVSVELCFDKWSEASGADGDMGAGGTPAKPERWFAAADYSKTVKAGNYAWKIAAKAVYNPPANLNPLTGVTDDESTTAWVFGAIQNSEGLDYKYGYGGPTYGNVVKARALDVSKMTPKAAPFYHDNARAPFVFGQNGVTIADNPTLNAPADDASGNPVSSASIDGKFYLYFALLNPSTGDVVYLWHNVYDVHRKWQRAGGSLAPAGTSFTLSETGPGRGATGPVVLGGATSHAQLNKGWTKP